MANRHQRRATRKIERLHHNSPLAFHPNAHGAVSADGPAVPRNAAELQALLTRGLQLHRDGQLEDAGEHYDAALAAAPDNADALHLKGVLAYQTGDDTEAATYINRAIEMNARAPSYHNNLANVLRRRGDLASARAHLDQALALQPNYADALSNMGHVLADGEDSAGAVAYFRRALDLEPNHADAGFQLGMHMEAQGDDSAAMIAYQRVLAGNPGHAEAHNNLGSLLNRQGRFDEALNHLQRAVELNPDSAMFRNNLGATLCETGHLRQAEEHFGRAIALKPSFAEAHSNLGYLLVQRKQHDRAVPHLRRALELQPNFPDAVNNLAVALADLGRYGEAVACLEDAAAAGARSPEMSTNLGNSLTALGRYEDGIRAFDTAVEMAPGDPEAASNRLFCLLYDDRHGAVDLVREFAAWDERYCRDLMPAAASGRDPDPDRRLRIGYVSPDFREHAVAYFIHPLIAAHDRDAVEVYCYSDVAAADAETARFQEMATAWRDTVGLSDSALAEQIRADGVDVLVDLAGHTAGNRLRVFARRPAPLQVAHPVGTGQTTGMSAFDHILADAVLARPEDAELYVEEPLVLPRPLFAFLPSPVWPEVATRPAGAPFTFASFNKPARIGETTIGLWSAILERAPGSRLLLVHRDLRDNGVRVRLADAFAERGVDERVELRPLTTGWSGAMDVYGEADVALDTFPMNGGTTTAIALWMGLPVVTLCGEAVHSRFSASIAAAAGFADCIAHRPQDYIERACAFAADPAGLAEIRAGMRARLETSPLMDHAGAARAVEGALREAWTRWCRAQKAA